MVSKIFIYLHQGSWFCSMWSHIKGYWCWYTGEFSVDLNIIKYGEFSAISSDISKKQIIVYTSACIESDRIEKYHSDKQLHDNCSSHTWNEDDDAFDKRLEKRGCSKIIFR